VISGESSAETYKKSISVFIKRSKPFRDLYCNNRNRKTS